MSDKPFDQITGQASPPPETDTILVDEGTVIQTCKQQGERLEVEETPEGVHVLKQTAAFTHDHFGPLVRLWRAFTRHDIFYLAPDDAGITSMKSNWLVPESVYQKLNSQLSDASGSIRRLSTWPITRCFLYVDVSDFSQQRPGQQALIIGSLIAMIRNWHYWNSGFAHAAWSDVEAMLCIGDGYIFVLKDVVKATYFAAYLAQLIEARVARQLVPVEFHFRMGMHIGPVYCFWDWGRGGRIGLDIVRQSDKGYERTEQGDWNYIGEGINGGQRVLAAVGKETDDVLFISGRVRQKLAALDDGTEPTRKILHCLLNRGRRADKHNKFWRVYEVNHTELCGSQLPSGALT